LLTEQSCCQFGDSWRGFQPTIQPILATRAER